MFFLGGRGSVCLRVSWLAGAVQDQWDRVDSDAGCYCFFSQLYWTMMWWNSFFIRVRSIYVSVSCKEKSSRFSLLYSIYCLPGFKPAQNYDFFPFDQTMSDAFSPLTHAVFLKRKSGPELNRPFVCPHKTRLPAFGRAQDWGLAHSETESGTGSKQVPVQERGGNFSCLQISDRP